MKEDFKTNFPKNKHNLRVNELIALLLNLFGHLNVCWVPKATKLQLNTLPSCYAIAYFIFLRTLFVLCYNVIVFLFHNLKEIIMQMDHYSITAL